MKNTHKTHFHENHQRSLNIFFTGSKINQVENRSIQFHQGTFEFLDSNSSKFFKLHNTSQIHFSDLRKIFISKFLLSFVQVFPLDKTQIP